MAGSIVAAAAAVAENLELAGVPATHDPAAAAARRPCVLVPPPAIDYVDRLHTWRLVALAGHDSGSLAALDQLDQLVRAVVELLPIEAADPVQYTLTAGAAVPAYVLRFTT